MKPFERSDPADDDGRDEIEVEILVDSVLDRNPHQE
jgi:hypothetical protein